MAYIHVKNIGNKKYYTLRISARNDGRVITKDLANLGSDITKINIDDLEKQFKKEIRASYHTIKKSLEKNHYLNSVKKQKIKKDKLLSKEKTEEIEAIKLHFTKIFLKLDEKTQQDIFEGFILKFAVNSTSIEGNTITMNEARKLFSENLTPKNRDLREVYDLTNTRDVVNYLKTRMPNLTLALIIKIHDDLLQNIDNRRGIRNHDIRIFGQPFKPSPARYVRDDLELLLKWYKMNKGKMHPFLLACLFHHKFENIHPFSDGNGRVGRAIMNLILALEGYPPLVISRRLRKDYLKAMNEADWSLKSGLTNIDEKRYEKLILFVHQQYIESYWNIFLV